MKRRQGFKDTTHKTASTHWGWIVFQPPSISSIFATKPRPSPARRRYDPIRTPPRDGDAKWRRSPIYVHDNGSCAVATRPSADRGNKKHNPIAPQHHDVVTIVTPWFVPEVFPLPQTSARWVTARSLETRTPAGQPSLWRRFYPAEAVAQLAIASRGGRR